MLTKYAIAGVAASALLASVAFAQSPSANTGHRHHRRTCGSVRYLVARRVAGVHRSWSG